MNTLNRMLNELFLDTLSLDHQPRSYVLEHEAFTRLTVRAQRIEAGVADEWSRMMADPYFDAWVSWFETTNSRVALEAEIAATTAKAQALVDTVK